MSEDRTAATLDAPEIIDDTDEKFLPGTNIEKELVNIYDPNNPMMAYYTYLGRPATIDNYTPRTHKGVELVLEKPRVTHRIKVGDTKKFDSYYLEILLKQISIGSNPLGHDPLGRQLLPHEEWERKSVSKLYENQIARDILSNHPQGGPNRPLSPREFKEVIFSHLSPEKQAVFTEREAARRSKTKRVIGSVSKKLIRR